MVVVSGLRLKPASHASNLRSNRAPKLGLRLIPVGGAKVKTCRQDYHYFKEYAEQNDLPVMFNVPESCNSIHDDILDGKCDAVKLTVLVESGLGRLLASFGNLWTDDMSAVAAKLES